MRHSLLFGALFLGLASSADARGLLIPKTAKLPPLAMVSHQAKITIEDQIAVTRVEQIFRNPTDNVVEATYVFPIPKGASVQKFALWIDGKEVTGELVAADKARKIYTEVIQRTLDPGLLEYLGNDLLRLQVASIQPKKDQKISLQYTSVATADQGIIEFVYPLKADGKTSPALTQFALDVHLKSQHPLQNIYCPTHQITVTRPNDREAKIVFEKNQAIQDHDFQLFYMAGPKSRDVGLTALTHRPRANANGYFMLLVSPRAELSKNQQIPRDFVFVLDTSGSMRGKRIIQARNALKYCLRNLEAQDRFAIIDFCATVRKYQEELLPAEPAQLAKAAKWVEKLEATSGTAINAGLMAALDMRSKDASRTFTIVFFTDGQPTVGETNVHNIQKNVQARTTPNTRIFSFGVGDDVNASFLDQLAESNRGVSTFVRENEDIEVKVSSLYSKISSPVLANLKLSVDPDMKLAEVYPPQLPDLFRGSQLMVLGRFTGKGKAAIKLTGQVGKEQREFIYELNFPEQTAEDKHFVEDLWARRKVGYLLDQIRLNGEKKELVEEVVALAKRYGITTPYTSYLIVQDARIQAAAQGGKKGVPQGLQADKDGQRAPTVAGFAQKIREGKLDLGGQRAKLAEERNKQLLQNPSDMAAVQAVKEAQDQKKNLEEAKASLKRRQLDQVQSGNLGVNLSVQNYQLRNQQCLTQTAVRRVCNRTCLDVGGVWIDEGFDAKMTTVTVKAMSKAYFRLLERQPQIREVLQLGNYLVWVTPSHTALAIDVNSGLEEMADADIDRLFVTPKK